MRLRKSFKSGSPKLTDPYQTRVLHVITSLDTGGAEMMLVKLLRKLKQEASFSVIVLMNEGKLGSAIKKLGIPLTALDLQQGQLPGPVAIAKLISASRKFRPTVIQGWMYHGNLAALLALAATHGRPRLFWNIRQTLYRLDNEQRLTRLLIRTGSWFSGSPDAIVYNSELSALQHESIGYSSIRRTVLPNGFDISSFRADPHVRSDVRRELNVPANTRIVGHIARYHPMKGHASLIEAARLVLDRIHDVRFLLVGRDVTSANQELAQKIRAAGLDGHMILLGERHDVSRLMTAMDVAVSASAWGEGFPNVIGEAMATEVPCVATDVGDSAYVVGDGGRVVCAGDPLALADAISGLLELSDANRRRIGRSGRDRVRQCFSIDTVAAAYLDLYRPAAVS